MSKRVLIFLAGAVVAGCGGGSGGGSATVLTATTAITSNDAVAIAGATMDAALFSSEFDELANLGVLGSSGGVAVVQSGGEASVTLAKKTSQLQAETAELSVSETSDCPLGGTMSVSADIQNPETLSAGDSFSLSYADCDFGEGVLANGGIGFRVTSFQGDLNGDQVNVGFDLDITNLRIAEVGDDVTINGDLSMSLDISATATSVALSGDSLSVSDGIDSYSLANWSTTVSVDLSSFPEAFTMRSSGFLMSSQFDGEVQFSTTVAMQGNGEGNPFTGEFVVTGANGATITVIPMDAQTVRLELDLDGDGAVDTDGVRDTTWQELLNTDVV